MSDPSFISIQGPALEGTSARWGNGYMLPPHEGIIGGTSALQLDTLRDRPPPLRVGYPALTPGSGKWEDGVGSRIEAGGSITFLDRRDWTDSFGGNHFTTEKFIHTLSGALQLSIDVEGDIEETADFKTITEQSGDDSSGDEYNTITESDNVNEMDASKFAVDSKGYPFYGPSMWEDDGSTASWTRQRRRDSVLIALGNSISRQGVGDYRRRSYIGSGPSNEYISSLNGTIHLTLSGEPLAIYDFTSRRPLELSTKRTRNQHYTGAVRSPIPQFNSYSGSTVKVISRVSEELAYRMSIPNSQDIQSSRLSARVILHRRKNRHSYYSAPAHCRFTDNAGRFPQQASAEIDQLNDSDITYEDIKTGYRDAWGDVTLNTGWEYIPWYYLRGDRVLDFSAGMTACKWYLYSPFAASGQVTVRISIGGEISERQVSISNGMSSEYFDHGLTRLIIQIISTDGISPDTVYFVSQTRSGYLSPFGQDAYRRIREKHEKYEVTDLQAPFEDTEPLPEWPYPKHYRELESRQVDEVVHTERFSALNAPTSSPSWKTVELSQLFKGNDITGEIVEYHREHDALALFQNEYLGWLEPDCAPDPEGEILETQTIWITDWERNEAGNLQMPEDKIIREESPEDNRSNWFIELAEIYVKP